MTTQWTLQTWARGTGGTITNTPRWWAGLPVGIRTMQQPSYTPSMAGGPGRRRATYLPGQVFMATTSAQLTTRRHGLHWAPTTGAIHEVPSCIPLMEVLPGLHRPFRMALRGVLRGVSRV